MVLFCERCHQQGLALLYSNSLGNASVSTSVQIALQIPATHHLTFPLVLNLIFPMNGVTILVVLDFQPLDQFHPFQSTVF